MSDPRPTFVMAAIPKTCTEQAAEVLALRALYDGPGPKIEFTEAENDVICDRRHAVENVLVDAVATTRDEVIALLEVARYEFLDFTLNGCMANADLGERLTFNAIENALRFLRTN